VVQSTVLVLCKLVSLQFRREKASECTMWVIIIYVEDLASCRLSYHRVWPGSEPFPCPDPQQIPTNVLIFPSNRTILFQRTRSFNSSRCSQL